MTKQEFQTISSDIDREASRQAINLSDPANTFTVWLENPRGSGNYLLHGRATTLEHAKLLAGPLEAIIRRTDTGRLQIIVWKDRKWLDSYADEQPLGGA